MKEREITREMPNRISEREEKGGTSFPLLKITVAMERAHFRRISTNHANTLSYLFPPRPTLLGFIGACMGKDIHEVYGELSDQVKVAFQWDTEPKAIFPVVNRLNDKINKIYSRGQDTVSYLVAKNQKILHGEILLSCHPSLLREITNGVRSPVYAPFFGSTDCLVAIQNIENVSGIEVTNGKSQLNVVQEGEFPICTSITTVARTMKGHREGKEFARMLFSFAGEEYPSKYGKIKVNESVFAWM